MMWRGVLAALVVANFLSGAEGACPGINADLVNNRWHVRYFERSGSIISENYAFSDTEIRVYDGAEANAKATLSCGSDATAFPFLYLYATQTAQDGSTQTFCYAIGDTNDLEKIAYIFRVVELTTAELATITSANLCSSLFLAGSGRARLEDYSIMVRTDPSSATPFNFALTNGDCTDNLPEAYNRNAAETDADILLSLDYELTYTTNGMDILCENAGSSTLIRTNNQMQVRSCTNSAAEYYNPVSNIDYTCLTNSLHQSFGLTTTADIQIISIPDNSRTYFACMRQKVIGDGSCVQYSLDLTDREDPKCKIVWDQSDPTNTMVDSDTAFRDQTNANLGFMSFTVCSTDCVDVRCRSGSNCTQFLGNFRCGDFNGVSYVCPTGYEGFLCEININDCDPNPCLNGGSCNDEVNGFTCTCVEGFRNGALGICEVETCIIPVSWRGINWFYNYDGTVSQATESFNVFVDGVTIELITDEYDCERDTIANGVWSATGRNTGAVDTRRCFEGIEQTQVDGTGAATGDTFILYRTLPDMPNEPNAISPGSCGFSVSDPYQVLIAPNEQAVSTTPFPAGNYYQVTWQIDSTVHCEDDHTSNGIVTSNTMQFTTVCDANVDLTNSITNPINQVMSVVYYWPSGNMGDTNAGTNGDAFLVSVTFAGEDAPTYYCGRWTYDNALTIHISLNYANGLAPECLVNGNSMKADDSHLYIRLTSNICEQLAPCSNGGDCVNTANQEYRCDCPPGYTGDNCETDIDECASNPCHPEGTLRCEHGVDSWTCICNAGWKHDDNGDERCQVEDFCFSLTCFNGMCDDFGTGARCICDPGWTDPQCNTDINECESSPCQNGGTCKETVGANNDFMIDYYECNCATGYSGVNCQSVTNYCDPDPCLNDGICINYPEYSAYYCDCDDTNYIWQHCEHLNECKTIPCNAANTISCEDRLLDRICFCVAGFIGGEDEEGRSLGDCSQADTSNPCYSTPCRNGGECIQDPDDGDLFTCECRGPWTGATCHEGIITCANNPCPNGIGCTDDTNVNATGLFRYTCDCPSHLSGRNCENDDDDFGAVEQGLLGFLIVLILCCAILGGWAIFANRCGPCGPKGGCCP